MTKKELQEEKSIIPAKNQEIISLIAQAVDKGAAVETMEKLMTLQELWEKNQAKKAFDEALSNLQKNLPVIQKTKKVLNKDGRTIRYQYAPIESIIEQIKELLANNNLSYKWEVENKEGFIKATSVITHIMGHSEASSFEVPIDKEGFMTAPQKYASALTFAKRYAFCNALGIATADEDTDANDVGNENNVKSVKAKIMFSLRNLGYEPKTKEETEEIVETLTKLPLTEKNYAEISGRLGALVKEKQEYENTEI